MGLDLVELTIRVEETFGFTFTDETAAAITTVGELHAHVTARLAGRDDPAAPRCMSAAMFYRLRRSCVAGLGLDRDAVRPASPLATLVGPPRGRREAWGRLGRSLGVPLPPLVLPGPVIPAAFGLWLALPAAVALGLALRRLDAGLVVPMIVAQLAWTCLIVLAAGPLAVAFPAGCEDVRGLVGALVAADFGGLLRDREMRIREQEVWAALRAIIVEQLGVRPEDVTPGARFVEDFGAD